MVLTHNPTGASHVEIVRSIRGRIRDQSNPPQNLVERIADAMFAGLGQNVLNSSDSYIMTLYRTAVRLLDPEMSSMDLRPYNLL